MEGPKHGNGVGRARDDRREAPLPEARRQGGGTLRRMADSVGPGAAAAPAAAAATAASASRGREPPGLSAAQRAELAAVRAAARERRQLASAARAAGDRPGAGSGTRPFGVDYVEFRISEMRDTRGGFMAEEALPEDLGGKRRRRDNDQRREPVLVSDPRTSASVSGAR